MPLVGAHVGGHERPRPGRLDQRPGGRAGQRDRHCARAGRRPAHRRLVHPRQVLARGRPRVRRPARSLGVGAGAFEVARLRHRTDAAVHPPRARLSRSRRWPTSGSLGAGAVGGPADRLARVPRRAPPGSTRAACAVPARGPPPRRDWDARADGLRGARARGGRLRAPVGDRLDLVRARPGRDGAGGRRVRGRPRAASRRWPSRAHPWPARGARGAATSGAWSAAARRWCVAALPRGLGDLAARGSQSAVDRALELAAEGDYAGRLRARRRRADADPLSPAPLLARADVQSAAGLDAPGGAHARARGAQASPATPTPGCAWPASSCPRSTARGRAPDAARRPLPRSLLAAWRARSTSRPLGRAPPAGARQR